MAKTYHLSKKQLAVIDALFSGELDEQAVLDKYRVSRSLYSRWQTDDAFIEHFERRIAAAHRQSAALIARYAPLAAAKLVQLTESEREETARKACLDIISMPLTTAVDRQKRPLPSSPGHDTPERSIQLTEQIAGKLLAVLAEEKA